jgi:hypothetical protein
MPETLEAFLSRLKRAIAKGQTEVRLGQHHFSHAVCVEDEHFRVRRLEATREEMDAYRAAHGMFMPESLEEISKPRTLVFEATSLDAVAKWLAARWPL